MPRIAKRSTTISVRLTADEEYRLKQLARAREESVSVFLRRLLKELFFRAEKKAG